MKVLLTFGIDNEIHDKTKVFWRHCWPLALTRSYASWPATAWWTWIVGPWSCCDVVVCWHMVNVHWRSSLCLQPQTRRPSPNVLTTPGPRGLQMHVTTPSSHTVSAAGSTAVLLRHRRVLTTPRPRGLQMHVTLSVVETVLLLVRRCEKDVGLWRSALMGADSSCRH